MGKLFKKIVALYLANNKDNIKYANKIKKKHFTYQNKTFHIYSLVGILYR